LGFLKGTEGPKVGRRRRIKKKGEASGNNADVEEGQGWEKMV